MPKLISIDPGTTESAYVIMEKYDPIAFGKIKNEELLKLIYVQACHDTKFVIERVASYGMAVGKEVFETCEWVGRFTEAAGGAEYIYRKDVKINLCGSVKAKDANIRQALIDRFGDVGVKANKGFFYGFKADIWSAYSVGCTFLDVQKGNKDNGQT